MKLSQINEGATGLEIPVAMWAAGMVGWWWPEIEKAAYKAFKAGKKWFKGEPIEEIIQKLEAKKNIDKQLPFIEKIQKRIKKEYNWYHTWKHILENIE